MKFEELKFEPHTVSKEYESTPVHMKHMVGDFANHTQARYEKDGKEFSIIFGQMFYSDGLTTYEVMELGAGELQGYLTKTQVEEYINGTIKS